MMDWDNSERNEAFRFKLCSLSSSIWLTSFGTKNKIHSKGGKKQLKRSFWSLLCLKRENDKRKLLRSAELKQVLCLCLVFRNMDSWNCYFPLNWQRVKWTRSASPGQLIVWINRLLRGIPSHSIWLGCYLFSLQSHLSIDCTGISKHYLVSFPGASFLIGAIAFCDTTTFRKHTSPKGRLNSLFGYPQCPSMLLVKTWFCSFEKWNVCMTLL